MDGKDSADPDNGPQALTFSWTFVQVPADSTRTNADILEADQKQVSFAPDKAGTYTLRLTVSDGEASDTDEVVIEVRAQNGEPIANAGADRRYCSEPK